mmetsp:Transcript_126883/g.371019  ORF Transcript_126883/g.371019 Transcript_126883/m.371019 type:complete len:209 (+) Transcript_126883:589-1215(+)
MAEVGSVRRDVPLSISALQPAPQPKSVSRCVAFPSGAAWIACSPCGKTSRIFSMRTLQVRLPTTGMRVKISGRSNGFGSFQMRYPSVPGCTPRQTEKVFTPKLSSMLGFLLVSRATSRPSSTAEYRGSGACLPLSKKAEMLRMLSCTLLQASTAVASGGPRPMIASNAVRRRTGMWAWITSQNVWRVSGNGPKETRSDASSEKATPVP